MLAEFIKFVDSVLPSVDPNFRDGALNAIKQFEKSGDRITYLTDGLLDELSQGDIISKVPFSYFDEDGNQKMFTADAMVLTTSCHIDNKEKMALVPIFPLEDFKGDLTQLKSNKIFDYMYLSDNLLADKFVSFEYITAYSKNLIVNGIKNRRIVRIGSLNQLGYYFFVIKLTVFFLKKEDEITLNARNLGHVY